MKVKPARIASAVREHSLDLFHKERYSHRDVPGSDSLFHVIAPDGHYHTVDLEWNNCTCDGYKYKSKCKHLRAMWAKDRIIEKAVAEQPALYARAVRLHQQVTSESS